MKATIKTFAFAGLIACGMLFSACPVGIEYAPGDPGKETIDPKLIGTWTCGDAEAEVLKVKFEKGDTDGTLKVSVLERGEMYMLETDNLTGYCTEIKGLKFVYFKPDNEEKYYSYCYRFDGDDLVTHDVSLLVGGTDAVKSTESFRKEIEGSIGKDDWGKDPKTWIKEVE